MCVGITYEKSCVNISTPIFIKVFNFTVMKESMNEHFNEVKDDDKVLHYRYKIVTML